MMPVISLEVVDLLCSHRNVTWKSATMADFVSGPSAVNISSDETFEGVAEDSWKENIDSRCSLTMLSVEELELSSSNDNTYL